MGCRLQSGTEEVDMADKKKMSVAEMIAAARKADGGDAAPDETPAKSESSEAEAPAEVSQDSAPAKKIPKSGSGRPSVAEMLAMARAEKSGGTEKAAPKKAAAKKPAAKKTAPAKAAASSKPAEPRDTASILAAARKPSQAGPMSKAEAAAKEKANPTKKAKPKIVVPPMPEKPAYAIAPPAAKKKSDSPQKTRRGFLSHGFIQLGAACLLWTLATVKFMFPNVLREPPSKFKVGLPDAFPPGQVNTKFKAQFAVWISNAEYNGQQQIYALKSVCTHLGCTPNWLEAEQKFKCPCHGSGFYKDGVNFEGPAPRPLERYAIRLAEDGQIEIDKNQLFFEEKGEWDNPSCFIPV